MIQSHEGKILTAQDFLQEFTNVIKDVPGCVLIIDSTSALCAEGEFTSEIKSQGRNEGPKLLATFCRRMAPVVPVNRVLVIIIQHLIANTSGYGEPYYEDGGKKIQYQADTKLRCTSFQKWENAGKTDQVGQVINWQVKTAALTKPGGKFQSYLRYGYGLDDVKELIVLGLDMGIIEKGGAWFKLDGLDKKLNGEDNVRQYLVENPDALQNLRTSIESMI
jgi:recombination protein RecA